MLKITVGLIGSNTQLEKTKIQLMASGDFTKVNEYNFSKTLNVLTMEESIIVINLHDLYNKEGFKEWLEDQSEQVLKEPSTKFFLIYDPKQHIIISPSDYRTKVSQAFLVSSQIHSLQYLIQHIVVESLF